MKTVLVLSLVAVCACTAAGAGTGPGSGFDEVFNNGCLPWLDSGCTCTPGTKHALVLRPCPAAIGSYVCNDGGSWVPGDASCTGPDPDGGSQE